MQLTKGGNVRLGPVGDDGPQGLVLGLDWAAGTLDCDTCALVCGADRKVLSDEHFVFWNNLATPDRQVILRNADGGPRGPSGPDRAQVLVALGALPDEVDRIVVSLSTLVDGATLSQLSSLRLRALDAGSGEELARFEMGRELSVESCLLVAEVYRHRGDWKLRAIGAGYHTGLVGLSTDFGVQLE